MDRVHDLAHDVELELGRGPVADPHRARVPVAPQVVQRRLGARDVPVDAVEDVQALAGSASVHRAPSQVMKAPASSVKPSRISAYTVNAASRTHVKR